MAQPGSGPGRTAFRRRTVIHHIHNPLSHNSSSDHAGRQEQPELDPVATEEEPS